MEKDLTIRIDADDLLFRATVENVNEETRTFDVVFATETPVPKMDWNRYVMVDEILEISEKAIDASRIAGASGVPFLDNHNQWTGSRGIFGVAEGLKIVGKKAISTIRMSDRPGDPVLDGMWHDIKSGIIRTVSVGYRVHEYEKNLAKEGSGKRDVYRATKWTPMEISTANVPADHNALKRTEGKENNPTIPTNTVEVRVLDLSAPAPVATPIQEPRVEPSPIEKRTTMTPEEIAALEKRNAELAAEAKLATERANKLERDNEVRTICEQFKFDQTRTAEYLNSKLTVDEVRAAAIKVHFEADPSKGAPGGLKVGERVAPELATRMTDAILLRASSPAEAKMTAQQLEGAREFRSMSLVGMARELMAEHGVAGRRMDDEAILKIVMGKSDDVRNAMLTSDFTNILGNAVNRTLRAAYELAPQEWKKIARKSDAKDFRPMTRTAMGSAPRLKKVIEGAEITRGALKDSAEAYAIESYGVIVELSWKAIVNDDLGAFGRLPAAMAAEVAQLHSDIMWEMILANPTLDADGVQVFHSTHANVAASGTALDVTNVSAARLAMRKQKDMGTPTTPGRVLNVQPNILVVGPELETAAFQLVNATIVPNTIGSANPFKGMFEIVVDPRIEDKRWYLFDGSPRLDGIEYAYLNGKEYWMEQDRNFNTSGYAWKIESAFGASFLDYRFAYLNAGL